MIHSQVEQPQSASHCSSFDWILSGKKLNSPVSVTTGDNTPRFLFCLQLQQCHLNFSLFVWFRDAGAWIRVGFWGGGEGSGVAAMSWWPLWLYWKAQQGKRSLAYAQQSLLKLPKGWVATDGPVNNHSPTHAPTHARWCTNTPTPHPVPYHKVEMHFRHAHSYRWWGSENRW